MRKLLHQRRICFGLSRSRSSGEDVGFVGAELAAHGLSGPAALEAPYLSAGSILAQSDMVAVLGSQIAGEFRRAYPIEIKELPFKSPEVRSIMLWHRRLDDQPGHRWLREVVAKIARKKVCPGTSKIRCALNNRLASSLVCRLARAGSERDICAQADHEFILDLLRRIVRISDPARRIDDVLDVGLNLP